MKLKPGDLYFVQEQDVITGQTSDYFKIGLVGDERTGGVDKRVKEHQTGNPRQLVSVTHVSSPAIEDLETTIHNRFAIDRIRGEWFQLDSARFDMVVGAARSLAAEQSTYVDVATKVGELDREVSSGSVRTATSTEEELHRRLRELKVLDTRVTALSNRVDGIFRAALDGGAPVGRFVSLTTRKGSRFDKDKFGESYPELLADYTRVEQKWSHSFLPKIPKASLEGIEPGEEFLEFEQRMIGLFDAVSTDPDRLEELHLLHLELQRFEAEVSWDDDLRRLDLMAACGIDDGIEGIAMWKRETRESLKFDESAFKADHPELHAQFVVETESSAFTVLAARGYSVRRI